MNLKNKSFILLPILAFQLSNSRYSFAGDSINIYTNKPVRIYNTTRLTTSRPVIDGVLNDECWKTGEWAGNYTQWIPNEGAKPSQPTQLKILFDNKNIYVAIRAFDNEPKKISRRATRRDEIIGDMVGINFDSYHDYRTGFEFNVTAAGQKVDVLLTNPSNPDVNWNAVWYVKVGYEDSAWVAEYEIPLSQLRYSNDKEQVWGMHSWRWIDRLQEESDWEPQSSKGPGMLYLFGELHGIKDLPKSRRIEIMPYLSGSLKTFKKDIENPYTKKGRTWLGNAGIDAKIGLSSNFTADMTINPDFGQVESDPSVMNLTAFETLFEEKRPFFLEGKNIFNFDFDDARVFHSRRIGDVPKYSPETGEGKYLDSPDKSVIIDAVKISGKTSNGFSLGVLQSITANETAHYSDSGSNSTFSVQPLTNYTVARLQQDFKQGNTVVGGIFTSTNRDINEPQLKFISRSAYTGGIDLLHQWNDKEFYIDAKIVGSQIKGDVKAIRDLQNSSARYYQRPDLKGHHFDSTLTKLSGYGGRIKIGKGSKGLWRYSTELNWRSPGLDLNDIGFMQMTDMVKQTNSLSYFVNQPVSIFRTYTIAFTQTNNWDFGMHYLSSSENVGFYLEFLNKWAVLTHLNYLSEATDQRILRGGPAMKVPPVFSVHFYARTDYSKRTSFDLTYNQSESQNQKYYLIQPGITVMPVDILRFSLTAGYSSNIDKLQYVDTKSSNNENKYILAKLRQKTLQATFKIDCIISPEISIQYYGSPFKSLVKYSEFKKVTNPLSAKYSGRYENLNPVLDNEYYKVYENNNPQTSYTFNDPNKNFYQFRSNLVFRWEYRPGSQLYFVWSNDRTYEFDLMKREFPTNIFLVKFNYWFPI
jgi:hypothetical protein